MTVHAMSSDSSDGRRSSDALNPEMIALLLDQIQQLRERDPRMALVHCNSLLSRLPSSPITPLWLLAQMTYAHVLIAVGRASEALQLCERWARTITHAAVADDRVRSQFYAAQGIARTYLGELDSAAESFYRLLELAQRTGNQRDECRALLNLGWVHTCMEKFPAALGFFSRALVLSQQLHLETAQAVTLENMGVVYGALGNDELALKNYQQAYELRRRGGYTVSLAQSMLNIAVVHNRQGQHRKALTLARPARKIAHRCRDIRVEAYCLTAMGRSYSSLGFTKRGLAMFQAALRLWQQIQYKPELCMAHTNVAEMYRQLDLIEQAQLHLEQAYRIANEIGEPSILSNVCEQLYRIAKQRCSFDEALGWLEKHHQWYISTTHRRKEEDSSHQMMMEAIAKLSREHEDYRRHIAELEALIEDQRQQIKRLALELTSNNRDHTDQPIAHPLEAFQQLFPKIEQHDLNAWLDQALQRMEHILPGFIRIFAERFPSLTSMELLICAMLRLQLQSKQIADILGLSAKTIYRHREHIRAKCGVGRGISLVTFISSIS